MMEIRQGPVEKLFFSMVVFPLGLGFHKSEPNVFDKEKAKDQNS